MGARCGRGGAGACFVEVNYVLTPEAEAELLEAVTFYAQNVGKGVAENFLATFEQKAQLVTEFPSIGTPSVNGRRLFPIGRFPLSMLYRVETDELRISAIAHHSRGPGYWRKMR
jgi:toxin ParE1/3/4